MARNRLVSPPIFPKSKEEVQQAVLDSKSIYVMGINKHHAWRCSNRENATTLSLRGLNKIISIEPADQVAVVQPGISISDLQSELKSKGQCLPYAPFEIYDDPSIGGAISLALPHLLEAQCGTWRNWVLGMTVLKANGEIAKCGSTAVKNVAGYDVARLFVGARGSLGIILEVILRTLPLKTMPIPETKPFKGSSSGEEKLIIQRVRFGDREQLSTEVNGVVDKPSATSWFKSEVPPKDTPRFEGDWVLGRGFGAQNFLPMTEAEAKYWKRAKYIFDPNDKLNPGEFPLFEGKKR